MTRTRLQMQWLIPSQLSRQVIEERRTRWAAKHAAILTAFDSGTHPVVISQGTGLPVERVLSLLLWSGRHVPVARPNQRPGVGVGVGVGAGAGADVQLIDELIPWLGMLYERLVQVWQLMAEFDATSEEIWQALEIAGVLFYVEDPFVVFHKVCVSTLPEGPGKNVTHSPRQRTVPQLCAESGFVGVVSDVTKWNRLAIVGQNKGTTPSFCQ